MQQQQPQQVERRKMFREPERNKYVPDVLNEAETKLRESIQDAKFKTQDLKAQLTEAEILLQQYKESCGHALFYDEAGIPYTIRYCGICERKMETI